jgi:S1-C subfamily serine protease
MKRILLVMLVAATAAAAPNPWVGMGLKLRNDASGGKFLYVVAAPKDAPAYKAGIREGDLITAIDGKPIRFRDDLEVLEFSAALRPGKVLKLRLIRGGKPRELKVRVGELPAEYEALWEENLKRARAARQR